jgi:hypothetical protein
MAPLPANGTPRFKITYTNSGGEHTFQMRSHASPTEVATLLDTFFSALDGALYATTIGVMEFAADNSNIFIPVTQTFTGNSYGSGSVPEEHIPWFYGFIGRGATGRKWHLDVFGAISLSGDYRFNPGENTALDDAVDALQTFGADLVDIADAQVTVYDYINAGVNAYWQRKMR